MIRSLLSFLHINKNCRPINLCVLLVLAMLGAPHWSSAQVPAIPDTIRVQQYNQKAVKLMNEYKYKESLECLEQANKIKENAVTTEYIARIHLINNEWPEALKYSERAAELDPTSVAVYSDLFFSYIKSDDPAMWKKGKDIGEKYPTLATNQSTGSSLYYLGTLLEDAGRSKGFLFLCLAIFAVAIFYPIYKAYQNGNKELASERNVRFGEALLVSSAVCFILYLVFFAVVPWAWAQNTHIPASEFAIGIRVSSFEHDGAESFMLYFFMFAAMGLSLLVTPLLLRLRKNMNIYVPLMVLLFLAMGAFFYKVGFYPPTPTVDPQYLYLPFVLGLLSLGLYVAYQRSKIAVTVVALLLSAYCGLVILAPNSMVDLMYMVAPGLRLYHGAKVTEIYFQYDLMLSYLFFFWMKLNWALDWFPYVGTVSFFLFFAGSYFFADKFYMTKGLAAMTIIAVILIRMYIQNYDNPAILQVSPLRLDLWLILLLVACWKGIHHWALGLTVGLLIIFHRNLGLIYFGAYIELLVVLFLIDVFDLMQTKQLSGSSIGATFLKHLRQNGINLGMSFASVVLCFVLFKELFSESAVMYRKLGFGMLPVSVISFYWYVPVLLGSIAVLLYYWRRQLGERYVAVGAFLVLLAIGNSMYFFGRSHENNVLNIAGVLVLAVFLLFDMIIFLAPAAASPQQAVTPVASKDVKGKKIATPAAAASKNTLLTHRNVALLLPVLFIFTTAYFYSKRVVDKLDVQYNNFVESNYCEPLRIPYMDTVDIRKATENTDKVYFLEPALDFYFYYYGKYVPQGYYNPTSTWIFKKDMVKFIQDLLDKGYCVVYHERNLGSVSEYLSVLRYNRSKQVNDAVSLSKVPVKLLLPEGSSSALHLGIKDSLANDGIEYAGATIKEQATFEFLLRPDAMQQPGAMVANNLSQFAFEGLRGFTFQAGNGVPGQYLFGFSNGSQTAPYTSFTLDPGKWHYVVATVNGDQLKVYVDGRLAGSVPAGGTPVLNSDMPITIGNRSGKDSRFRGEIKEVNISNDILDDTEVARRWQKLETELNNNAASVPQAAQ